MNKTPKDSGINFIKVKDEYFVLLDMNFSANFIVDSSAEVDDLVDGLTNKIKERIKRQLKNGKFTVYERQDGELVEVDDQVQKRRYKEFRARRREHLDKLATLSQELGLYDLDEEG